MTSSEAHTYEEALKQGLQGVIIAESFQKKFKPASHEKLKCMFPVANVPILHYVIEFLLMNKVTEIFIATCTLRGQIDSFVKSQGYKGVRINVISLESCTNFGDALREINQMQTIKEEFILVRGDLITNADIQGALKEHYRVKAEDKEKKLILTKLFVKVPFSNPIRSSQQEIILMLDSQSRDILKYESFQQSATKSIRINEEYIPLKQSTRSYELRYDLLDAEICICSRHVLNYFTDNYDYQELYDDFINQIQSSEIIDDRIMAYEVDAGAYYARVLDPRTYGAITQDILSRHLHPLVIDSQLLCPKSNYVFQSFNKYFDSDVTVALNTYVSNNCQIGMYSKVGTNSRIEHSTIGKKSVIGKNVKITNCYIWNKVEIQDGCEISDSIICDNVIIKKNSKISGGSIVSFGVHVKEGVIVPPATMASRYSFNSETLSFEEYKKFDNEFFDVGLIAYLPRECQLNDNELLGTQSPYLIEDESDFEEDDDHEEENERIAFFNETKKTLERCHQNKFTVASAIMEMKSLKMTYNMEHSDCVEAFFPVLMGIVAQMEGSADDTAKRTKNIQTFLTSWKVFLKDFVREEPDQYELLRSAEIYAAENPLFTNLFHIMVQVLYTLKVLSSSVVQNWSEKAQESLKQAAVEDQIIDDIYDRVKPQQREKFIKDMNKFIAWLKEQGDDDDDEEESESSSSSSSEGEDKDSSSGDSDDSK